MTLTEPNIDKKVTKSKKYQQITVRPTSTTIFHSQKNKNTPLMSAPAFTIDIYTIFVDCSMSLSTCPCCAIVNALN